MNFVSVEFIVLLLVTSILYFNIPKKYRYIVLLLANIVFYIVSSKFLTIFLLLSILSVFVAGKLLNKINDKMKNIDAKDADEKKRIKKEYKKEKKLILILTILINIGFLVNLKYNLFVLDIFNDIFKTGLVGTKFVLPLGISYYTLEAISYIVDVYNGKYIAENNFAKLSLYLSFFPLMVEGPISRYDQIGHQLYEPHDYDYNRYKNGLLLIVWGFLKKLVIADRAAIFVDAVFANPSNSGLAVIVAMILYTIQIYIEFSGCMDIVKGSAALFGIDVVDNFKRPFLSTTIEEFWRRWHITLGTWLRDYIFYPISISKTNLKLSIRLNKWKNKFISKFILSAVPLFFVWFLNGLWHGPSIKYIVYGLYYYVLMMIGLLLKPVIDFVIKKLNIKTDVFSYKLLRIIKTIIIVVIGMTLFRATTLLEFKNIILSIFKSSSVPILSLGLSKIQFIIIFVYTILVFIVNILEEHNISVLKYVQKQNLYFEWLVYLFLIFSLLIFGMYGSGYVASSFIYGGF